MEIDVNSLLIVAVPALLTLVGVWLKNRFDARNQKTSQGIDLTKITIEAEVNKEQILDKAIQDMFDRLQQEIEANQQDMRDLRQRVDKLETTERKMLAWMAMNGLGWPPPRDVWDSL